MKSRETRWELLKDGTGILPTSKDCIEYQLIIVVKDGLIPPTSRWHTATVCPLRTIFPQTRTPRALPLTNYSDRCDSSGQCHSSLHNSRLHSTSLRWATCILRVSFYQDDQNYHCSIRVYSPSSKQPTYGLLQSDCRISHISRDPPFIAHIRHMDNRRRNCANFRSIPH